MYSRLGGSFVGEYVQPQYLLPLTIVFVGVALLPVGERASRSTRLQLVLMALALVAAPAVALHENIRRHVSGLDVAGLNLNRVVEWWWPIPISPMAVWIAGTLAFAATVAIVVRELDRARRWTVTGSRVPYTRSAPR